MNKISYASDSFTMALVLRAAFLPCLYILLYAFLAASFTSFNAASARWRFFIYQKTPAAVAPKTEAAMMILFMTNEFWSRNKTAMPVPEKHKEMLWAIISTQIFLPGNTAVPN